MKTENKEWIFDIETLKNCFTASFINKDTDDIRKFVVWKNRNDLKDLLDFLHEAELLIGFNNLAFDYPVIHFILINGDRLLKYKGEQIARRIYKESQDTIAKEWAQIRQPIIPQIDLFTIHHFSNPARMTSLKKLEIAMKYDNVQDMPIDYKEDVLTDDQIDLILGYNVNDIKATKEFYKKTLEKIELRKGLKEKYGLDCLNYSDSKIGEELTLKLYCEATGRTPSIVKKGRTYRKVFKFKECIPSYVKFETDKFNEVLEDLKQIEVTELKQSFDFQFTHRDIEFFLGTGGIHACCKEGIYESDEDNIIVDCDVASLYPSLAVVNEIYPEHLGKDFCAVYKRILDERLVAKRSGDKVMADGYKLSLNSVYGKSNSEYSFLYDPLYTLKTTLAGQLSLCMLSEMLFEGIPELKMLQANTDGITVVIPRSKKRQYWEICKAWEAITKLELEYVAYEKMIIRDVNNYIALSRDAKTGATKTKYKGTFKPHEQMMKDGEYYKSFSQGIVPIAISEYFLKGTPVEDTVKNHTNIYDFCKTFSAKGKFECETFKLDEIGNEVELNTQQKTIRYYVSNKGVKFRKRGEPLKPKYNRYLNLSDEEKFKFDNIKTQVDNEITKSIDEGKFKDRIECRIVVDCDPDLYNLFSKHYQHLSYIFNVSCLEFNRAGETKIECVKDWRLIDIEAGDTLVTIFNQYKELPFNEYDVNFDYYIDQANRIIDTITGLKERLLIEKQQERERERMQREERNFIQFCINKIPTQRQFDEYKRDWLMEKYGEPKEIKTSRLRTAVA